MNKMESINALAAEKPVPNPSKELDIMVDAYLANLRIYSGRVSNEMEVRFGTGSKYTRMLTKLDYLNVVKKLYSIGFTTEDNEGFYSLRIQNEYMDSKSGIVKMSNIRAEVVGSTNIKKYCRTNSIQRLIDDPEFSVNTLKFTRKSAAFTDNNQRVKMVDFTDFNFRVAYQREEELGINNGVVKNIINKWSDSKKLFRHINRVRFTHPDYPIFIDISVVKGSKKSGKIPIPHYTVQDAGVFDNIESYEIEIEVDNSEVGVGTKYDTTPKLVNVIRKTSRIILSGLQGTNYPVSYAECDDILQSYMKLLHGDTYVPHRVLPRDFSGPSSKTLHLENIIQLDDYTKSTIPNIRNNYSVTDKADGDRKLLYIANSGRMYMIDTNMNVIFTGTITLEKTLHNSLFDGEHIRFDKNGKYINTYAAFDVYFIHGKSVRELSFMKIEGEEDEFDDKYRLHLLSRAFRVMKPILITEVGKKQKQDDNIANSESCRIIYTVKTFYSGAEGASIFEGCARILSNIDDDIYEYNTDGLIFTPCSSGVGGTGKGTVGPLGKRTWDLSFKWKPAEYNTIDFLVSVKKTTNGVDEVHTKFIDGHDTNGLQQIRQYKTIILRCGFNEKIHGFLNPAQNIIDDVLPSPDDTDSVATYKPVPFQPTSPYDPQACFCNIFVDGNTSSEMAMRTEEGEIFEEHNIVEFKYVIDNERGWNWVPIRLRTDKTAELLAGQANYGNAYNVANDNWKSIHSPITNEMITTGEGLPAFSTDIDVYYNRTGDERKTVPLRNFHNLYVKRKLIVGVADRNNTLIDYAVGKSGDLSKWIQAKLGFVYGIDISRDNIHNNMDGACARYLTERKKNRVMHDAMFVTGDSSLNIRSGEAFSTEKDKMISRAIFGNGPKDRKQLGNGVYKQYGVAHEGFNISSCQFAMHYFFETPKKLHSFLRNLAECTKMGGYFIGTCYDGKTVFELLKDSLFEHGVPIMLHNTRIFELTKLYHQTGFPDDEMSIGYAIDVYQETINKVFREYLVNFDYFTQLMDDYGFILISREEAEGMGFPNGTGLFNELFDCMMNEIKRDRNAKYNYGTAHSMTQQEKRISFLNRYFIFKKVRTVNSEKIENIVSKYESEIKKANEDYDDTHDAIVLSKKLLHRTVQEEDRMESVAEEAAAIAKRKPIRKIKAKKFIINEYSPVAESAGVNVETIKSVVKSVNTPIVLNPQPTTSVSVEEKKKPKLRIIQ